MILNLSDSLFLKNKTRKRMTHLILASICKELQKLKVLKTTRYTALYFLLGHSSKKKRNFFCIAMSFSNRHTWFHSSTVYSHKDSDQSHCYTRHLLYSDRTGCYSQCRNSVGSTLLNETR